MSGSLHNSRCGSHARAHSCSRVDAVGGGCHHRHARAGTHTRVRACILHQVGAPQGKGNYRCTRRWKCTRLHATCEYYSRVCVCVCVCNECEKRSTSTHPQCPQHILHGENRLCWDHRFLLFGRRFLFGRHCVCACVSVCCRPFSFRPLLRPAVETVVAVFVVVADTDSAPAPLLPPGKGKGSPVLSAF